MRISVSSEAAATGGEAGDGSAKNTLAEEAVDQLQENERLVAGQSRTETK